MALTFQEQQPYEKVILFLRRHYLVVLQIFGTFVLLAVLPIGLYALIRYLLEPTAIILQLLRLFISVYFLFWLYGLFYALADYILDVWIVTDHRIIDIKQDGLFQRTVAETILSNIQDVESITKGFLATIFNFGNVEIQTAAAQNLFEFEQVPRPEQVKDMILALREQFNSNHLGGEEIHAEQ